jgi:hypothetical protein
MTKKRTGEKAGWIGGWAGSFIWILILAGLFFYRQKFAQGVVGIALTGAAVVAVLYCAPWRHPSTSYWKLMLAPYGLFFIAVAWAVWSFGGIEVIGFNWWNLLWLLPTLSPFGFLSNRRWTESDALTDAAPDRDVASLHPRR